jgi:hypothetical protein
MVARALSLALAALLLSSPAFAAGPAKVVDTAVSLETQDEARQLAEAYLKAISREGDENVIDALLGGATLTARIYTIENWKIVGREKHRNEKGRLEDLHSAVNGIDAAGRNALAKMVAGGEDPDGLEVQELSADEAAKLLQPTRTKARQFTRSHPVFAYIARVDKHVYWHPQNPFRKVLKDAGAKGDYVADFDLFWVETVEGVHDPRPRKWPLRVVRVRTGEYDSGLKILPASDWNAE